jgi:hypothetical protein
MGADGRNRVQLVAFVAVCRDEFPDGPKDGRVTCLQTVHVGATAAQSIADPMSCNLRVLSHERRGRLHDVTTLRVQ